MATIEPEKLELLRTALPKGLAAGDSGIGQLTGKTAIPLASWPQFQVTQSESKLYSEAPPPYTEVQTISSGGVAGITLHPWAIYSSTDEDGNTIVKIEYNSKVYQDTGSFDIYPVTGLDAWIPIQIGYVTLEASIISGVVDEIIIQWGDDGSLPRAQWDVDDNQTVCRIRLGYIYQDENGGWIIRQDVRGQLTLINTCSDGKSTYCFFQT